MCLNQGALSCSGTHFIKPSSWGRGSMRPHIYHTNPSGLSPPCTDSMCVIGACPPDQTTHWLPALIHFHFHLFLFSVKVSYLRSPSLSRSLSFYGALHFPFHSPFVLHFTLSPILVVFFFRGDRCCPALTGFWTLLCLIAFPHVLTISLFLSLSQWCERYPDPLQT